MTRTADHEQPDHVLDAWPKVRQSSRLRQRVRICTGRAVLLEHRFPEPARRNPNPYHQGRFGAPVWDYDRRASRSLLASLRLARGPVSGSVMAIVPSMPLCPQYPKTSPATSTRKFRSRGASRFNSTGSHAAGDRIDLQTTYAVDVARRGRVESFAAILWRLSRRFETVGRPSEW